MRYKKTDVFYILFTFMQDFAFVYAVYAIIFRNHGLTFIELSILLTVWGASSLLFEIPSGIIADLWSRKMVVFIALFLKGCGFLMWLLLPNFTGFAMGFILWGASGAFCSGTLEALLYDALKLEGREDRFERLTGIGRASASISIALATSLGGFLFRYSQAAVLVLSAASMVLAGFCILPVSENRRLPGPGTSGERTDLPLSIRELLGMSRDIFSDGKIRNLVLFGAFSGSVYGVLDEFDSLFGLSVGVPVSYIGLWVTVRFILESSGGLLVPALRKRLRLGRPRRFAAFTAAGGILLLLGSSYVFLLPLYFLFYPVMAASEVLYQGTLQRRLESSGRATLSSVAGFVYTVGGMLLGLLFGFIAEAFGLKATFVTGACIVVASAAIYGIAPAKKTFCPEKKGVMSDRTGDQDDGS